MTDGWTDGRRTHEKNVTLAHPYHEGKESDVASLVEFRPVV